MGSPKSVSDPPGAFIDLSYYNLTAAPEFNIPEDPTPFADGLVVAHEANPALMPLTDPSFRGFDMSFPDYYRFTVSVHCRTS